MINQIKIRAKEMHIGLRPNNLTRVCASGENANIEDDYLKEIILAPMNHRRILEIYATKIGLEIYWKIIAQHKDMESMLDEYNKVVMETVHPRLKQLTANIKEKQQLIELEKQEVRM